MRLEKLCSQLHGYLERIEFDPRYGQIMPTVSSERLHGHQWGQCLEMIVVRVRTPYPFWLKYVSSQVCFVSSWRLLLDLSKMVKTLRTKTPKAAAAADAPADVEITPGTKYNCGKCDMQVEFGELCPSSKTFVRQGKTTNSYIVDVLCSKAYKSLQRRWKKQRRLQTWFDDMTTDERIEWYRTCKKLNKKMRLAAKAGRYW